GRQMTDGKKPRPGEAILNMRMPAALKQRLDEVAGDNRRTLSAEVILRLERSFDPSAMIIDALNAMGPYRNPLGASAHVRTIASAVYGDEIGDLGWWFVTNLALVRGLGQSGAKITLRQEDLDRLKAA